MRNHNQIKKRTPPSTPTRPATTKPILRFTSKAWEMLSARQTLGDDRVRGIGITAVVSPLVIEDIRFLDPLEGADAEFAEFFAREIERELPDDRYARMWFGTRPGRSARPTVADEAIFARLFGTVPWSVLFLAAHGGATYARLRYRLGPGGAWRIPVVVDAAREPAPGGVARELEPDDDWFRPEEWPVTM